MRRIAIGAAGCLLALWFLAAPAFSQPAGGYQKLSDLEETIKDFARDSNGDATASKLKDSKGKVIVTVGVDPVNQAKDIQRRNIWLLKIAKLPQAKDRIDILITGTQHAREWVSYRVVMETSRFLLDNRANANWPVADQRFDYFRKFKDMNVQKLLENANVYVVPVVNPEGYQYSFANDPPSTPTQVLQPGGWRKNRRDTAGDPPGSGPTDMEGITPGVDLNRSYPSTDFGFVGVTRFRNGQVAIRTSRFKDDDTYCGRPIAGKWGANQAANTPILELETEAIVALSTEVSFLCNIDVHSYTGLVGWAERADATARNLRPAGPFSDELVFEVLGQQAASMIRDPGLGGEYIASIGPYPTSGDILSFQYEKSNKRCLTFLIEVGKNQWGFRPFNAPAHAQAVLPGELFMMFAAVDRSFASKPAATFRKP